MIKPLRLFRVSLFLGLLIFSQGIVRGEATQSAEWNLTIPETVTVSGSRITLLDLVKSGNEVEAATANLQEIELGAAPLPGQVRTFSKDYLSFIIKQHNIEQTINLKMGSEVTVRAEATCIRRAEIEIEIGKLLTEKKKNLIKRWIELQNLPEEIWLNRGEWKIEAFPVGDLPEVGRALFKVVLSKGTESKSINISGRIKAIALVYKAKRGISSLAEANPDDFDLAKMELTTGREFVGDIPAQTRITKKVRRGEILRIELLQPIPLVCRNHAVKIIIRNKNVIINIIGIANDDGWLGDDITIINPSSYQAFKAKVIGNGVAEVNL